MGDFRQFFEHIDLSSNVEEAIVDLYRHNAKIEEIKQATNASVGKIYRTLDSFGLKGNRLRKDHNMIHYYKNTWQLPVEQIAGFTKYSSRWIREILKREG